MQTMHIVHRDLTPSNVMVSWGDAVKLTDFGLSRHFSSAELLQSCVGTLMYSCPELAAGKGYTEKADIWAAGCLLYQMATLQPPFVSSNALALVNRIVAGDYAALPDTCSAPLRAAVEACLKLDPDQRPDILGLCAIISDQIMLHLDGLQDRGRRLERQMNEVRQERGRQSSRGQQGLSSSIGSGFSANLARTLSPRRPDEFPRWNSGSSMREDATDGSSPHSKGDAAVDLTVSDGSALSHSNASTTLPDPEVNAPSAELDVPQASQTRGLRRSISNPLRAPPGPVPLATTPPTMGSASRPVSRTAVTPPVRASSGRQRRCGVVVAVTFHYYSRSIWRR